MVNNRTDISQVLDQMRAMRAQMQQNVPPKPNNPVSQVANPVQQVNGTQSVNPQSNVQPSSDSQAPSFGQMFKSAIDTVNASNQVANDMRTRFEMGDPSVDLPDVMVASQKASISFQALNQTRNKMVEAYKEIMNMPV